MKPIGFLLMFALSIAVVAAGATMMAMSLKNPDYYNYEGNLTLNTTEEYSQFKDFVVSPDIYIVDLDVSSNSTPVEIEYDLNMAVDNHFPYDYEDRDAVLEDIAGVVSILMMFFGGTFAVVTGLITSENL